MVSPILLFDAASTLGPDAASAAPPADCAPTSTFFPPLLPQAPTSAAAAATAINRPTTERRTNAAPPPGPAGPRTDSYRGVGTAGAAIGIGVPSRSRRFAPRSGSG